MVQALLISAVLTSAVLASVLLIKHDAQAVVHRRYPSG